MPCRGPGCEPTSRRGRERAPVRERVRPRGAERVVRGCFARCGAREVGAAGNVRARATKSTGAWTRTGRRRRRRCRTPTCRRRRRRRRPSTRSRRDHRDPPRLITRPAVAHPSTDRPTDRRSANAPTECRIAVADRRPRRRDAQRGSSAGSSRAKNLPRRTSPRPRERDRSSIVERVTSMSAGVDFRLPLSFFLRCRSRLSPEKRRSFSRRLREKSSLARDY